MATKTIGTFVSAMAFVKRQPARGDVLGMPRPIEMHDSIWIEDLTMMSA
jgi:hypothetical protein